MGERRGVKRWMSSSEGLTSTPCLVSDHNNWVDRSILNISNTCDLGTSMYGELSIRITRLRFVNVNIEYEYVGGQNYMCVLVLVLVLLTSISILSILHHIHDNTTMHSIKHSHSLAPLPLAIGKGHVLQ